VLKQQPGTVGVLVCRVHEGVDGVAGVVVGGADGRAQSIADVVRAAR
jgi:hypothetical protein